MKHKVLLTTFASLIIVLVLSACGSSAVETKDTNDSSASSEAASSNEENSSQTEPRPGIGSNFENALPESAQLALGTFLLEETDNSVNPAQAADLLPLWKAARSLSQSETVAEAELDAVFNQIQSTMTSEQLAAISAMQLTGEDMSQVAEDIGLSFGFGAGGGFGNLTPEQQETAQAARESGQGSPFGDFPSGGNPGGQGGQGFQGFGGGQLSPEQQETMEARRAERGNVGARFALIFADPLIELLEVRAAE